MAKEIERQFIVEHVPFSLDKFPHSEIEQGYLVISENGDEIRVRSRSGKFYQTYKSGTGLTREEIKIELNETQFNTLWPLTAECRIKKVRYKIPWERYTIDLDIYEDKLKGFISAEVEFKSEQASREFVPPDWFGKEVTHDERYKNRNLARFGLP
ncbi:MAG: adenylate cyclase [Candidatus Dadabacteria bacterium]|nr:MAG: adenylate cyclase [Candidatus Dadabacteria bacterium]